MGKVPKIKSHKKAKKCFIYPHLDHNRIELVKEKLVEISFPTICGTFIGRFNGGIGGPGSLKSKKSIKLWVRGWRDLRIRNTKFILVNLASIEMTGKVRQWIRYERRDFRLKNNSFYSEQKIDDGQSEMMNFEFGIRL